MIRVNCDIGERGADHPVDVELMGLVQIANIACGGHAGDTESVAAFRKLADRNGVEVSAHLSYPDPPNFGRLSMEIEPEQMLSALDEQYDLMPDVKMIKFHGALYNDACVNRELAELLAQWIERNEILRVIAPFDSILASECRNRSIGVLAEAFAERNYAWSDTSGQLTLVSRKLAYASISDCDEAVQHVKEIVQKGRVNAYSESGRKWVPITADTICIHSDSVIALELAGKLFEL